MRLKLTLDIRQLEIFCEVAELKSFSKAASSLYYTQPTVSSHIASLEKRLGATLFDRKGRTVTLTKAGEILYRHATQILRQQELALQELSDFLGQVTGDLWLGASTIPGQYILPAKIAQFKALHPGVTIHLHIASSSEIVSGVQERKFEMGIVGYCPKDRSLRCRKLWSDEIVLAAPAKHRLAKQKEVGLDQLREEPFVFRESGSGTREAFERFLMQHGIDANRHLKVVCELGSTEAVKQFVASGGGIAPISHLAVEQDAPRRTLKAVRVKGFIISRDFYCIRLKHTTLSPICTAFAEFIERKASE